jgi:hypothetical protein
MDVRNDWFSFTKVENLEQGVKCPCCKSQVSFGPLFDHHYKTCLNCGKEIWEWNVNQGVFIFCSESAPLLIKKIQDHLIRLTEYEAFHELKILIDTINLTCHSR